MVSFTCHRCQDVIKKPKVLTHASSCRTDTYSCVDCMQVFTLDTIKSHTQCISEEDKYQGAWKQKCTANGNPKHSTEHGHKRPRVAGELDSDGDDMSLPPPPLRPPRAAMNLTDSDDDDDWAATSAKAAEAKKPTTRRSASSTPLQSAKKQAVTASPATKKHSGQGRTRETPLMLPRSTASADCEVPAFILGTATEVAEIVQDILTEHHVSKMTSKEVAKALVGRYTARIAKSVRVALATAVELRALKEDAEGNLTV